jgi:PAS domain S-box-containing protein
MILLIISSLLVLVLSFYAYYLANKNDKVWFYVYSMMIIILVQWMSDMGSFLIFQNYYFHLSSVLLFPSVIFGLFIVYIFQGLKNTNQLLGVLIAGEFSYIFFIGMLAVLNNTPPYVNVGLPWLQNHFFSTLAVIFDYFILVKLWPLIHTFRIKLPVLLKTWVILFILLMTDSLIFTLGTFWGSPDLIQIISSNTIVRFGLSLLITPFISIYIASVNKNDNKLLDFNTWDKSIDVSEYENVIKKTSSEMEALQRVKDELVQKNREYEDQSIAMLNLLEDIEAKAIELEKFKQAVDNVSDLVVITDLEGIVIYGNQAIKKITGYEVDEAIGKKAGKLWRKPMNLEYYENLWSTIKNKKQIFEDNIINVRKDGTEYQADLSITPILDKNNKTMYFVGIERDVTREKEIDKAKTEFISLASHQLRTPLSTIKWYIDGWRCRQINSDKKTKAYAGSDRMVKLVNALLNVSRIESGTYMVNPQPVDVVTSFKNVIADNEQAIMDKKLKINFDKKIKIPLINLDPNLVTIIFQNLFSNAVKYTLKNGNIDVDFKIDNKINSLLIKIKDDGLGIPLAQKDKIFTKLFRADNVQRTDTEGTGLGLYLIKSLIDRGNGKIWFESVENKGTTFYVTLPLSGMEKKDGSKQLS